MQNIKDKIYFRNQRRSKSGRSLLRSIETPMYDQIINSSLSPYQNINSC